LAFEPEIRKSDAVAVVTLKGKITLGDPSQTLRTTAEQLISEGFPKLVFNLAGVTFIDSAGLGSLTLAYSKSKAAGGLLKLVAAPPRVREALDMTRLTMLFPASATEQEAIDSF
jgi:anti-anti-sigma factor